MRRAPPVLVLFFLAPAIGELLSGSAPPVEFFNPLMLIILPALYGSGAVLIREIALRWDKRWPTILVLGLAYGILEEGLMVKSFFDPGWQDLGILGVYGRWGGVNWVWSLFLTIYHAVFSITIPIFLVELLYPHQRDEKWVGRRGIVGLTSLLLADVLFGLFYLTEYRPPVLPYVVSLAGVVGLVLLGRRMPQQWSMGGKRAIPRPMVFGLVGFIATLIFFLIHWILPEVSLPVLVTMAMAVIWTALVVRIVLLIGGGSWTDAHRLALVSGAMTFFVLLAPLAELDASRPDNPAGMTAVGFAALGFLLWLRNRTNSRLRQEKN